MRTKEFIKEFRKNWLIISLGSVCFSIGFFVINANEGELHQEIVKSPDFY